MRVAHQESKLLIWLHLSTWLVNRDKDLVAHHQPVQVRPGKGLQAKQSESLRAQNSSKSRIKTEMTRLTVYTITPMH